MPIQATLVSGPDLFLISGGLVGEDTVLTFLPGAGWNFDEAIAVEGPGVPLTVGVAPAEGDPAVVQTFQNEFENPFQVTCHTWDPSDDPGFEIQQTSVYSIEVVSFGGEIVMGDRPKRPRVTIPGDPEDFQALCENVTDVSLALADIADPGKVSIKGLVDAIEADEAAAGAALAEYRQSQNVTKTKRGVWDGLRAKQANRLRDLRDAIFVHHSTQPTDIGLYGFEFFTSSDTSAGSESPDPVPDGSTPTEGETTTTGGTGTA